MLGSSQGLASLGKIEPSRQINNVCLNATDCASSGTQGACRRISNISGCSAPALRSHSVTPHAAWSRHRAPFRWCRRIVALLKLQQTPAYDSHYTSFQAAKGGCAVSGPWHRVSRAAVCTPALLQAGIASTSGQENSSGELYFEYQLHMTRLTPHKQQLSRGCFSYLQCDCFACRNTFTQVS